MGNGRIVSINGIINQFVCKEILFTHSRPVLPRFVTTVFQQDNDLKHTEKLVLKYLNSKACLDILLECPLKAYI